MRKAYIYRGIFYSAGLLVLALGITLNTKAGLGVSPIISVPYCISEICSLNFGNMTFLVYSMFVVSEMILHTMNSRKKKSGNLKLCILSDALQLPLSLIFTRFMNLFADKIPDLASEYPDTFIGSFAGRMIFLIIAIILTGAGAAVSLNMRIVPNPGDGIVQAIADTVGKGVGFTKNCFDLMSITITIVIGMVFTGHLPGIGIGTVFAVIGVGRVIAVFNHFLKKKMAELAGIEE